MSGVCAADGVTDCELGDDQDLPTQGVKGERVRVSCLFALGDSA